MWLGCEQPFLWGKVGERCVTSQKTAAEETTCSRAFLCFLISAYIKMYSLNICLDLGTYLRLPYTFRGVSRPSNVAHPV